MLLHYWDSQPHVIEASGDDMSWDWGQELATDPDWRDLVIASVADKPIGIMQIINPAEEETHYSRAIDIWRRGSLYRPRIWGSDDGARAANVLRRIRSGCGLDRSFGGQYRRTPNSTSVRDYDELSGGASAMTIVLSIGWTAKTGPPDNERRRGLLTGPARNPFLTGTGGSSATFGRSCRPWSKEASAQLSYERIHARDTRFNA